MLRHIGVVICLAAVLLCHGSSLLSVSETGSNEDFPIFSSSSVAVICTDADDYRVVDIVSAMLAEDILRVTGVKAARQITNNWRELPKSPAIVAGTLGHSKLVDQLVGRLHIDVDSLRGKWESYLIVTTYHPKYKTPLLLIIGSDRRGTAFGLTTLSEAIGVSPWYWWADVTPQRKSALYINSCHFLQKEPSIQYRGVFINDERFGGWARWAEQTFDKETGSVGPKTYQKVFELLLRLKANYLWPAMHPGTAAFNSNPENARLADNYAIVMGSSHCEQMLRNNEGEWKSVGTYGDFNYITNRETMQNYWEERVKSNGKYENTYTLGLRGIHDYPMEGANSTEERVRLMQQAIDDQRDMLRRNIHKPIEDIPQVLCTYEEVLEAYHNGLRVPDDVTLLWSDDKHGYCRNLCNPTEMQRSGGAGIYYHLSYHGDPASWIWLSPLSPSFLSAELTKAYTFGARKIWVFNVGDIKPAEKEISFVMDLAWDIDRWRPEMAHEYTKTWTKKIFGHRLAEDIADILAEYYRLQAAGKDAHVWFVDYTEQQIDQRIAKWRLLADKADSIAIKVAKEQQNAYFELIEYPVRGAALLNEYSLLARRSMVKATRCDSIGAINDGKRVEECFRQLNMLTDRYNNRLLNGKWGDFFSWQPYHWFRSEKIEPPYCTPTIMHSASKMPVPQFLSVDNVLSHSGVVVNSDVDADVPVWINAQTPIRDFSKEAKDNTFCRVRVNDSDGFLASATPINNVWHAHSVGPMWSRVGVIHLNKGLNRINISDVVDGTRIDNVFIGLYPPFASEPRLRMPASVYNTKSDTNAGEIKTIKGLGYCDGVAVQPFDTPSYSMVSDAPYVEYDIDFVTDDREIEVRTLPTLHVYEGREARYAVQIDEHKPYIFSIHADDFTPEWRLNVLRGYASRVMMLPSSLTGKRKVRIYMLDPGIVLQELLVR